MTIPVPYRGLRPCDHLLDVRHSDFFADEPCKGVLVPVKSGDRRPRCPRDARFSGARFAAPSFNIGLGRTG